MGADVLHEGRTNDDTVCAASVTGTNNGDVDVDDVDAYFEEFWKGAAEDDFDGNTSDSFSSDSDGNEPTCEDDADIANRDDPDDAFQALIHKTYGTREELVGDVRNLALQNNFNVHMGRMNTIMKTVRAKISNGESTSRTTTDDTGPSRINGALWCSQKKSREKCPWHVNFIWTKASDVWKISKLTCSHSHELNAFNKHIVLQSRRTPGIVVMTQCQDILKNATSLSAKDIKRRILELPELYGRRLTKRRLSQKVLYNCFELLLSYSLVV